jgi:tRNA A-37 threonylcarbamoyl transferase component Bud32
MTDMLGSYELRGELGRGAMAIVWRGFDPKLAREVAIKEPVIPHGTSPEVRAELAARFVREGRAIASLQHPGIVTVHAADIFDDRPAIVMELVQGTTLSDLLKSRRRLDVPTAVSIATQLLDALAYAHAAGIVHRDVKPDNVFVTPDGRIKLADFGIARLADQTRYTQEGTVMGTPGYMAPEQVRGLEADARADVFSVGAILYEMLTGKNPFGASDGIESTAVMYRIVHESPEPAEKLNPQLPGWLGQVADVALAKDPANRYQGAEAMRTDLLGQVASVKAPTALPGSARSGLTAIAVVAGALVLAIVALFFLAQGGRPSAVSAVASAPVATTTPAAVAPPQPAAPTPAPARRVLTSADVQYLTDSESVPTELARVATEEGGRDAGNVLEAWIYGDYAICSVRIPGGESGRTVLLVGCQRVFGTYRALGSITGPEAFKQGGIGRLGGLPEEFTTYFDKNYAR